MFKYLQQQVQPRMLMLLMASILAFTLLAGYLYVFKQPLKEFRQLQQQLDLLKNEMESGIPLDGQIQTTENSLLALKKRLYGINPQLPVNQKIAAVIGQLDSISGGQHVSLASIKPGEPNQLFLFQELPFNIEINGSYFSLFNWLYQVEKELGPIVVKEFDINPGSPAITGASTNSLNMKLTLASYQFTQGDKQ